MSFTKLFQPKQNPFGLYIYTHKDSSLSLKLYSQEKLSESKLSNFKGDGAYCNSFTHLFISESKDFWIINHSTFQIRYKKMQIPKKNHSMIFIPPLNSDNGGGKIFIVGGADKKSIYYDLKKNYFLNWAPTNEIHIKPALIQIGEYLYLFNSVQNNQNFCFERTKLTDVKPHWEKIIPTIDQNILSNFPKNTFAVSLDDNNNIVFLGGDNINMPNNASYIYNLNQNKIYLSQNGTNDCMNFVDKTFYKINETYIALPEDLGESKEIAIIDRKEQSLIKNNINDNIRSNLCSACKKKENEINNINLNMQTKTKLRYDNEPKEFGYYISSCSSEQSKITAKKNKIKIIEFNQNYKKININTNIIDNKNINVNIQQQKEENKFIQTNVNNIEQNIIEKNIESTQENNINENININNIQPKQENEIVQEIITEQKEEIIQDNQNNIEQKQIEENQNINIEENIEQKPAEIYQEENNENEVVYQDNQENRENPEEEHIDHVEHIEQKQEEIPQMRNPTTRRNKY